MVGRDCLVTYETMLRLSAHSCNRGNSKAEYSLRCFPGSFVLLDIVKAPEKFDCWPSAELKFLIHLCLFYAVDFRELNSRAMQCPSCLYKHSMVSLSSICLHI